MSGSSTNVGAISWTDLTVTDADNVRQFYEAVVGWTNSPVKIGDYDDYCMNAPGDGKTVAGICHARGENAGMSAQWLIYINVTDLEQSLSQCKSLSGKVLQGLRSIGGGKCSVIQDPAGVCAALFEHLHDDEQS